MEKAIIFSLALDVGLGGLSLIIHRDQKGGNRPHITTTISVLKSDNTWAKNK
jgi:hypothetical protein